MFWRKKERLEVEVKLITKSEAQAMMEYQEIDFRRLLKENNTVLLKLLNTGIKNRSQDGYSDIAIDLEDAIQRIGGFYYENSWKNWKDQDTFNSLSRHVKSPDIFKEVIINILKNGGYEVLPNIKSTITVSWKK